MFVVAVINVIFQSVAFARVLEFCPEEITASAEQAEALKEGNGFSASSFNSILTKRKYIGEYVYNRKVAKSLTGKYNSNANKPENEFVRIPNAVPRIIDDETFNKVQTRLNQNKRKVGTYKSK